MVATAPELDMSVVQKFAFKVFGDITAAQMAPLSAVADQLGLFQKLAEVGPATVSEFASGAGLNERYTREWLSAMACHGYVSYDRATEAFSLPPEHAFILADTESPFYLGSVFGMAEPYWRHVDQLVHAFEAGGGIPQAEYGERFWSGFERFTATGFRHFLCQEWIPALPSVDAALRTGGSAADVGCGNGQALLSLSRGYPNARLIGLDNYAPAIAAATANASAAGVADRVRFEVCDVVSGLPGRYDLITLFDVVHDMPHPKLALASIASALEPGGTCLVVDFNLYGDLPSNLDHPLGIGAFGYSASLNYCMTQALAVGGDGTGTCMGEERFRVIATEAGFNSIRKLDFPNSPFNAFYALQI
jgi:SAM-dependent methyltransferase